MSPVGCFYKQVDKSGFVAENEKRIVFYQGALAVCHDSGVVIIPKKYITVEFCGRLVAIEK